MTALAGRGGEKVKGRRFSGKQTGIVLSAENQAAAPALRAARLALFEARCPRR